GVGAVSLIGKIEESETVQRGTITTPWAPRDSNEPTIRYRVHDWQPLRTPVRNDEGQRVSESRWSTRLAVERATSLAQLSLESPLEWALHDALKAQRAAFRVQANEVRAVVPAPTRGRARFAMADGRVVTYVGASGFEVRSGDQVRYLTTFQRVAAYLAVATAG
ncbi:MAG: hypothetical protein JWR83_2775, partial [Aeromicrobium sp.]|nr:hypothetical protein [Aeromicrobium sp.]